MSITFGPLSDARWTRFDIILLWFNWKLDGVDSSGDVLSLGICDAKEPKWFLTADSGPLEADTKW